MKIRSCMSLSLLGLLFLLCQGNKRVTEDRKNTYRQILHGNWIPTKYYEAIKKTGSPIKSSKFIEGYSELSIDTSKIAGDSLSIQYTMSGGHEWGDFLIWFRKGLAINSFPTNSYDIYSDLNDYKNTSSNFCELGYEINKTDTFLVLFHYSKNKKLLDKSYFTKVSDFKTFVNSSLVAGKYTNLNTGKTVEFSDSGKVVGFDNFQEYSIQTDFVVTRDNNIDNIFFDGYNETSKRFAFKIKKDTLELYSTKSDSDEIMSIDSLKYSLLRKK